MRWTAVLLIVAASGLALAAPVPDDGVTPKREVRSEIVGGTDVSVGTEVRWRQTLALGVRADVAGRREEVIPLAEFNPEGKPRFLSPGDVDLLPSDRHAEFPGLALDPKKPAGPVPMKPVAPGRIGVDVPFTPKRPGVYLLRVTWELQGGGTLTGPPVVLTVRPKPAAK